MSLLLAPDDVALYPPGEPDSHGWALAVWDSYPLWQGAGNLQESPGRSDARAGDGGGHGPGDPATGAAGVLFLPPAAEPADGMGAVIRGQRFMLSQVRYARDPGFGFADCWTATVTSPEHWDKGGT